MFAILEIVWHDSRVQKPLFHKSVQHKLQMVGLFLERSSLAKWKANSASCQLFEKSRTSPMGSPGWMETCLNGSSRKMVGIRWYFINPLRLRDAVKGLHSHLQLNKLSDGALKQRARPSQWISVQAYIKPKSGLDWDSPWPFGRVQPVIIFVYHGQPSFI